MPVRRNFRRAQPLLRRGFLGLGLVGIGGALTAVGTTRFIPSTEPSP